MSFQSSLEQLRKTDLFSMIANDAIMGILVFDTTSSRCVYANRLAIETLEVNVDPSSGEVPILRNDLYPTEVRSFLHPCSGELFLTEGFHQNVLLRKANGLVIIANIGIRHFQVEGGAEFQILMFEDVTIQKKLQRELEAKQEEIRQAFMEILDQNKQLKELDNAKDRFIALTTHELRTPLSAIVATAEVLELKLYESDVQRDEFIKTIHEQGLHLMELVNDILDFAKIQAGKMEFYVEQLDIVPLVSKLAMTFEQMASQSQVTMSIQKPTVPTKSYTDTLRLKEVISNVVNNAIKYNRSGGKVAISFVLKDEKFVRIIVADTGPGIAANKLHHVFNEFETVGNVSRHHKGTGLGMPISKRLMQAMGGDLTLESVEGVGTSFFIDVPVEKVLAEDFYRSRADNLGDLAA